MSSHITGDWSNQDPDEIPPEYYRLQLYVAGASTNSTRAITNIKLICETHLSGRYDLEIIDVHDDGITTERKQIIALPMLVRLTPGPERRMIGDMSNIAKVLRGLGLA